MDWKEIFPLLNQELTPTMHQLLIHTNFLNSEHIGLQGTVIQTGQKIKTSFKKLGFGLTSRIAERNQLPFNPTA